MKKIEPAAYITYKGHLLHAKDPKMKEYDTPEPLYAREALEAAVEGTILVMIQRATSQEKDASFTCGISLGDVLKQLQVIYGE